MTTLFITHPECLEHIKSEPQHPERPDRLRAIEKALQHEMFSGLKRAEAPIGQIADIARAHPLPFIEALRKKAPTEGIINIDYQGETIMSPESWPAALRAVGASVEAVDQVMTGAVRNAFCSIRPPGHHAEPGHPMGFCFFNNAAIAGLHARSVFGVERVAVVDFDVHHGNGTQSIFWSDKNLFYASSHQDRLYPFSGGTEEQGCAGNIVNTPLRAGAGSDEFRDAYQSTILPALHNFAPDLLIISAGFDAHRDDPLGELGLVEDDYRWVTEKLVGVADAHGQGRVVSVLEGGYDLTALARSTATHVRVLMEFGA
jgi:acetoin utilization deacetylase AcuC-like enzyme